LRFDKSCKHLQWRSEGAEPADRPERQSKGGDKGGKMGMMMGASGISRLLGAAKLQSVLGTDNPRYATGKQAFYLQDIT